MSSLKLGDWSIEVPGYSPEVGDTGTADVLGTTYQTVIMPDGREWMAENLRRMDCGVSLDGDGEAELLAYGRGYTAAEFNGWSDLPNGWHVPSEAEWIALFESIGATWSETYVYWVYGGKPLKEVGTDHWVYTTSPGTDDYGFRLTGAGTFYPYPYSSQRDVVCNVATTTLLDGDTKSVGFQFMSGESSLHLVDGARRISDTIPGSPAWHRSVRLVRDVTPTPPTYRSGTHDLLVLPSGQAETTESLAQRVDIRLRTFIGEHWLNPELGVPWFEEFLRKAPDLAACRQILVAVLQDVPGVVSVDSLTVTLDKSPRQMRVSFVVSGTDSIPQSGTTAVIL